MKKAILIIEDNADVRENTAELLELAGYHTITASNGKEGLESVKNKIPDLVLCDIMMPELDGYGVLRAFDNIPEMAGKPFIFMTAKSEKSDIRKGMDLGADDYLTKPFTGDDLIRIIGARLKKVELMQKTFENSIHGINEFMHTAKHEIGISIFPENKTRKKLRKKDMLFMEGDTPSHLYYVVSGKIKVFKSNETGKELIVDIYKEGDFFGYVELIEGCKHKEFAMAIESSEVALIPKEDFFQLIYSDHDIALIFINLLAKSYSDAEEKLIHLAYNSARKRVAEAILFVYEKYQKVGEPKLMFNLMRENISSLSGISPESVSRNLSDFRDQGLIETHNGNIRILDLEKLKKMKN